MSDNGGFPNIRGGVRMVASISHSLSHVTDRRQALDSHICEGPEPADGLLREDAGRYDRVRHEPGLENSYLLNWSAVRNDSRFYHSAFLPSAHVLFQSVD